MFFQAHCGVKPVLVLVGETADAGNRGVCFDDNPQTSPESLMLVAEVLLPVMFFTGIVVSGTLTVCSYLREE